MVAIGTQYMMQSGLAAGMSATEGHRSLQPKPVDPNLTDPPYVLEPDFTPDSQSRIVLRTRSGKGVSIPYMSIGAWSWGDKATFGYNATKNLPRIHAAWEKLKAVGLTFVDTAQAYGDGESERICGTLFQGMPRDSFIVQTKWQSLPDMTNYVDIYLVHGPVHPSSFSSVAKGLAECVEEGLTRAVGMANYDTKEMIKMADELERYGVPLSVSQCEYSVIRRVPEISGMIRECRKRNICFQGFSSLAQGRLTGRYSRFEQPRRTLRLSSYPMHLLEPTIEVLKSVAAKRRVPVPAVALNYSINKGVVPLVGVRDAEQAQQDMQALGWWLSEEGIQRIEEVSISGNTTSKLQHG
ncbi:hypothetical protein N7478_006210 [Penicillium angulare]|uniref:uncharacterized protein n=1 Tax=Penicillium angulare TaxID=116970 RepID=UPI0025421E51|nr:uncharacterized protein N7478_006210 [Penicillium angulare]KAJ5280838.1 hypothetical protein N7478_006210 [Penicillium angulare]